MELKFRSREEYLPELWVLIVPLWNWNSQTKTSDEELDCSNCTFMELKFKIKLNPNC